jgi:hypothetical protein
MRIGKREIGRSMYTQSVTRLRKLSSPEILDWADQAGSWTARQMGEYRRHGAPEALKEATDGLQVLTAALDVLREREEAK